jgi:hypothetical protein
LSCRKRIENFLNTSTPKRLIGLLDSCAPNTLIFPAYSKRELPATLNNIPQLGKINAYFWLPRYAYDKDFVDKTYYSGSPPKTQKYIVVVDRGFMASKSGTAISTEDINPIRPPNHMLQNLLDNSHTIVTLLPDNTIKYNVKNYPYSNIRQNPRSTAIEIKSNY